jgi:hypothetical protein
MNVADIQPEIGSIVAPGDRNLLCRGPASVLALPGRRPCHGHQT